MAVQLDIHRMRSAEWIDVLRFRTQRVVLGRHLHKPLSGDEVLEQHHTSSAFQYDLDIAAHDRLTPPLVVHAPILTERLDTFPVSRFTTLGLRCSSSSTCTRWGALRARSLSAPFRTPHSALGFIVDQRVAPLGEAGPWLHLDDVIQHRPSDAECDLPGGALERTPPPGARRGARIAREQLQLRG